MYILEGVFFLLLQTQVRSHTLHCKLFIRKGMENMQKHTERGQNDNCMFSVVVHGSSAK